LDLKTWFSKLKFTKPCHLVVAFLSEEEKKFLLLVWLEKIKVKGKEIKNNSNKHIKYL